MTDSARATTAWSDPSADPIGDLRRYLDLAKEAVVVTMIEVNAVTLAALRSARSAAQRDGVAPGLGGLWGGVPVFAADDVPNGKSRVTWSDGRVGVIPDGT